MYVSLERFKRLRIAARSLPKCDSRSKNDEQARDETALERAYHRNSPTSFGVYPSIPVHLPFSGNFSISSSNARNKSMSRFMSVRQASVARCRRRKGKKVEKRASRFCEKRFCFRL